jgi:hypothetical protein
VLDTFGKDSEMNGAKGFVEKVTNALHRASKSALKNDTAADFFRGYTVTYLVYTSLVFVPPGHFGLMFNNQGKVNKDVSLHVGVNFVFPFFQRAIVLREPRF